MISCANPKAQYLANRGAIEKAIHRVLDSGSYVLGEEVERFEQEFALYNGVSSAIGVGSGTEALHIGLRALGIGPGDEVITSSHTAVATVSAIMMSGAKPVFIDVEQDSYTLDPSLMKGAITSRTRAVIPVHIYGHPCEMDLIMEVARDGGLKVIEDCAQAHGAIYKGKRVGSIGDVGCFSFYPTKNLGAIGDGGALVTSDAGIAEKIRRLRQYGWKQRNVSISEGWNSRLDELQAAILRVKLKTLDEDNVRRQFHASEYSAVLQHLPIDLPGVRYDSTHVFHLYVVRSGKRDALRAQLSNEGVSTGVHYPIPVHQQTHYRRILGKQWLPVTERLAKTILSLPMYPELAHDERSLVVNKIKHYYEAK